MTVRFISTGLKSASTPSSMASPAKLKDLQRREEATHTKSCLDWTESAPQWQNMNLSTCLCKISKGTRSLSRRAIATDYDLAWLMRSLTHQSQYIKQAQTQTTMKRSASRSCLLFYSRQTRAYNSFIQVKFIWKNCAQKTQIPTNFTFLFQLKI